MAKATTVPQPAQVDVTVISFVDVINDDTPPGDARLCDATWKLRTPAPDGIRQPTASDTMFISQPMEVEFNLAAGSAYRFAGIAFRRVRGSGSGNGHKNFPKEKILITERADGSSAIRVKDAWVDHSPKGTHKFNWDFYLIIQDSSGFIGIIDPDIENEE